MMKYVKFTILSRRISVFCLCGLENANDCAYLWIETDFDVFRRCVDFRCGLGFCLESGPAFCPCCGSFPCSSFDLYYCSSIYHVMRTWTSTEQRISATSLMQRVFRFRPHGSDIATKRRKRKKRRMRTKMRKKSYEMISGRHLSI